MHLYYKCILSMDTIMASKLRYCFHRKLHFVTKFSVVLMVITMIGWLFFQQQGLLPCLRFCASRNVTFCKQLLFLL